MICTKCHVMCRDVCPICESSRHLREAQDDEPVLLLTCSAMKTLFVEPVLEQSAVPYYKMGALGAALTARWGAGMEINRFYVPYNAYEKCRALLEDYFIEDEEIMHALHEFDQYRNQGV